MVTKVGWKEVAITSLPLILAQLSEIVFSLVDTVMVGKLGTTELASVGLSMTAVCFIQAAILGIGNGVQAQASRRVGEGKKVLVGDAMKSGIYLAITLGIPLIFLSIWLAPFFMNLISDNKEIADYGTKYFEIRMIGIIGYAINISFRGFWSSLKLDKYFTWITLISHALNIILNYLLIYGNYGFPRLEVAGSAIATNIALYFGMVLHFFFLIKKRKEYGFNFKIPKKKNFVSLLSLSVPSGLQQMFFWLGFVVLLWIVGKVGEGDLAITHVILQFNFVSILIGIAIGVASGAMVGRAMGQERNEEAYEWGIIAAKYAFVIIGSIGFILAVFTQFITKIYFEKELLQTAFWPFLISSAIMWTESIVFVFMYSLFGAGDMKRPVIVTVLLQWLFFLPLCYVIGYQYKFGVLGIWSLFAIYRVIIAILLYKQWKDRKWQLKTV
jgi:putative MATE family efflux protein